MSAGICGGGGGGSRVLSRSISIPILCSAAPPLALVAMRLTALALMRFGGFNSLATISLANLFPFLSCLLLVRRPLLVSAVGMVVGKYSGACTVSGLSARKLVRLSDRFDFVIIGDLN